MKNILQVLSFDVTGKVLLAVTSALLIRYMPQSEYVAYSVAYSLLLVFIQICSGSLNRIYLVGHAAFRDAKAFSSLLWTQVLLAALAVPVLIATLGLHSGLSWACAAALVASCFAELSKSRFQSELRFRRFSMVELGRAILTLGTVTALVALRGPHLRAVEMQTVNLVAIALIVGFNPLPYSGALKRETLHAIHALIAQLTRGAYRHLFAYFCLAALFGQVDLLVLKLIGAEHQVATYASAYRYYNILLLALNAINTVLFPSVQRIQSMSDTTSLKRTHRIAMALFIPGVVFCMCLAQRVIPMVDQSRYPGAPAVFYVLAISSIFSIIFSPYLNFVMRFEDFSFLFHVLCVALVVGVVSNLLLARSLGALGTAWSVLISTAILNISGFLRCSRYQNTLGELVAQ